MIGVIIPFYNNEMYIKRCVDSVINQSINDFKLFLIDDGSIDNGGKICDEYALKYTNVYVYHKANGGVSSARNYGIDLCMGYDDIDWITFIDGDDWIHKDYLIELYKACVENCVDVAIAGMLRTDSMQEIDKQFDGDIFLEKPDNLCNYNYYDVPFSAACGKMYSKQVIGKIRFPEGKIHEDEYTNWKWLFSVDKISCVTFPLYYYYNNPESIVNRQWSISKLDMLPAFREQLHFYKINNHFNMYNTYLKNYYSSWLSLYEKLNASKKCLRLLRKDLRLFLKHYGEDMPVARRDWLLQLLQPKRERLKSMINALNQTIRSDGIGPAINKVFRFIKK